MKISQIYIPPGSVQCSPHKCSVTAEASPGQTIRPVDFTVLLQVLVVNWCKENKIDLAEVIKAAEDVAKSQPTIPDLKN